MSALILAFLILVGVAGLAILWATVCNWRTHDQILQIIDAVLASPSSRELAPGVLAVSYGEHMHALLRGRDPLALYDPRIRALLP